MEHGPWPSGRLKDGGQYVYYGEVAGCVVTRNENGVKHRTMGILYVDTPEHR